MGLVSIFDTHTELKVISKISSDLHSSWFVKYSFILVDINDVTTAH